MVIAAAMNIHRWKLPVSFFFFLLTYFLLRREVLSCCTFDGIFLPFLDDRSRSIEIKRDRAYWFIDRSHTVNITGLSTMFLFSISLFIIVILVSFVPSLYSFNYQTVEHWRYLRQEQFIQNPSHLSSYFGYSLAVHRFR
jgi:hypothetical protein